MTDFADSTLATTTSYTALLQSLRDRNKAVARQLDGSHTNLPTGAVRWNDAQNRWEKYDGSAWNPLASLYNMNVSHLQGYQTSTGATANTIALRDAAGCLKSAAPSAATDVVRKTELDAHTTRTDNPHGATKSQVGLANVSNDQQLVRESNLSDLPDKPSARSNLGLGSAATTNSSDYATAAQGALADSALQPDDSINADSLGGFPASNYTRMEHRQSGQITITLNSIEYWYHYEYEMPAQAWAELRCISSDRGYAAGESAHNFMYRFSNQNDGTLGPYPIKATTTSVQMPVGDFAPEIVSHVAANTADPGGIDLSKWRLIFHAVWYRS